MTQPLTGGVSVEATPEEIELASVSKAGYYFDIINDHSITLQNNITDNYLENGTAVQDCIAHNPIVVSLRGLSGEVIYTPPQSALDSIKGFIDTKLQETAPVLSQSVFNTGKLSSLGALLPSVDNVTQIAKNAIQYTEASYRRYEKVIKSFSGSIEEKQTRLQKIYDNFVAIRASNTPLVVETPYTALNNMYIQSVTLRQDDRLFITDVELTLKQLGFADVETTKVDENTRAYYNSIATAKEVNCSKAQGVTADNNTIIGEWAVKLGADPTGGIKRD